MAAAPAADEEVLRTEVVDTSTSAARMDLDLGVVCMSAARVREVLETPLDEQLQPPPGGFRSQESYEVEANALRERLAELTLQLDQARSELQLSQAAAGLENVDSQSSTNAESEDDDNGEVLQGPIPPSVHQYLSRLRNKKQTSARDKQAAQDVRQSVQQYVDTLRAGCREEPELDEESVARRKAKTFNEVLGSVDLLPRILFHLRYQPDLDILGRVSRTFQECTEPVYRQMVLMDDDGMPGRVAAEESPLSRVSWRSRYLLRHNPPLPLADSLLAERGDLPKMMMAGEYVFSAELRTPDNTLVYIATIVDVPENPDLQSRERREGLPCIEQFGLWFDARDRGGLPCVADSEWDDSRGHGIRGVDLEHGNWSPTGEIEITIYVEHPPSGRICQLTRIKMDLHDFGAGQESYAESWRVHASNGEDVNIKSSTCDGIFYFSVPSAKALGLEDPDDGESQPMRLLGHEIDQCYRCLDPFWPERSMENDMHGSINPNHHGPCVSEVVFPAFHGYSEVTEEGSTEHEDWTLVGFSLQFCFSHNPEGPVIGKWRLEAQDGQKLFPMTNRDMLAVLRGPTLQWFDIL